MAGTLKKTSFPNGKRRTVPKEGGQRRKDQWLKKIRCSEVFYHWGLGIKSGKVAEAQTTIQKTLKKLFNQ